MAQLAAPLLPAPPSWYPGHMRRFTRRLPSLLSQTDVVLELRDARLPLTSINPAFEGALRKWAQERRRLAGSLAADSSARRSLGDQSSVVNERIVVLNKRDLVPEWGIQPFIKAMRNKAPEQKPVFVTWNSLRDMKTLLDAVVSIARDNLHIANELNVLVIGMPNVGKSTTINALRNLGISGRTPKALRTSAHPGLTRALSTRLKLSQDPLVYAFDSPGIMLPFLGKGDGGAERGVKLALIAGIKEGLYQDESLAAYLLHRLNILNPTNPAYMKLLPHGAKPTQELDELLKLIAYRFGMIKRGRIYDLDRAAVKFVTWWREDGCAVSASGPFDAPYETSATYTELSKPVRQKGVGGWGFDFQWEVTDEDLALDETFEDMVQRKMEVVIDKHSESLQLEAEEGPSTAQAKKQAKAAILAAKAKKFKTRTIDKR